MKANKQGLSFIELLVAIAIFSILSLAVFNAISVGLKVTRVNQSELKTSRKINRFFDLFSKELRNCLSNGFVGKANELSFLTLQSVLNENSVQTRQVAKISYLFGSGQLFKKQQYGENLNTEIEYEESVDLPLKNMTFKFISSQDEEMQDEWNVTDGLPFGVNIEMILYDERTEKQFGLSRQFFLPLVALNITKS